MNCYILRPFDLLMLGQPAPFNSAEQGYRSSSQILNPIPFFGAIRKYIRDFQIDFISLMHDGKFNFPVPFDVVKIEGKYTFATLKGVTKKFITSHSSDDEYTLSFGSGKVERDDVNFVDVYWLEKYLLEEKQLLTDSNGKIPVNRIYDWEYRAGIEIDRTSRTTKQGHLYFENFLRLDEEKKTGFYLKSNVDISDKILTIGGESKVVKVEKITEDINDEFVNQEKIKELINETGLFKLILLTPTNNPCEIKGAKLIAKIVGRPYVYSGWLRKDTYAFPSRLFRLIKPGAVFYYRIEENDRDSFVKRLFERFWLKPAFFKPDFPYFESINGINPLCLGLTIIGATKEEVKDE